MQANEITPIVAAVIAIVGAVAATIQSRRKPQLDQANVDKIKSEVKKDSEQYNARRDLELIRWQSWVFERVRPWGRDVVTKFDRQGEQLREALAAIRTVTELHLEQFPEIHLDPFPEMPPPLPPE